MRSHSAISSVRPTSILLAFCLAASLLVLTPGTARAHQGCAITPPAATGALGAVLSAVNVFASVVDTSATECPDKFTDVVSVPDRDWGPASASVDPATAAFAGTAAEQQAETFAACEDGMAAGTFPCDGVDMLSHVSLNELAGLPEGSDGAPLLNDMWGWTDPETGEEYALVGTRGGTVFVNVTDPMAPVVYGQLPTASTEGGSSWRDLKVYDDHVFVVSEHTNHGVQVFDLTRLRDWAGSYTTYDVDAHYTGHGSAHNININTDTGFAYSVGAGPTTDQLPYQVVVGDGTYLANEASFGGEVGEGGLTGAVELAEPNEACEPLTGFTAGAIAVVDRGSCNFAVKAKNAQDAGAIAVVVANNGPGTIVMGGADPAVTIPAVMISQGDGDLLKADLPADSGTVEPSPNAALCGDGLHMIDINDPTNPTFAGCFQGHSYVHDAQCVIYDGPDADYQGREICFNSNGIAYTGVPGFNFLSIVDVTDKDNPVPISRRQYQGRGYSHQGWLTEDQARFLHGDEGDEQTHGVPTTTRVWDVSDLDDPFVENTFSNGETSIDHNIYTRGGYAYAANYTTGFRLFDIAHVNEPGAPISEVAFFDTYPENDDATFEGGPWSNYPYFDEEGVVAVSAIDRGLFMLRPRLEGSVTVEATVPQATESTPGELTFTRDDVAARELTVSYNVGGDAVADTDYTVLPGTVTFAEGESEVAVPVEVLTDDNAPAEVVVTVTDAEGYAVGDPATATVTIPAAPIIIPPGPGPDPDPTEPTDPPTEPTDPPVDPVEDVDFQRLEGDTRIDTGIAVSQNMFPEDGSADAVILARADIPFDALAATPLARYEHGPLLLTESEDLNPSTAAEIERVLGDGGTVYLLGGTNALSAAVETALSAYTVERLQGPTRVETALAVADEVGDPDAVLLASADDFPDALSAGAAAAAADGLVLLSPAGTAHPAVQSYLDARPDTPSYAVGGPVASGFPDATPLIGSGREQTSVLVAQEFFADGSALKGLARGDEFADALTGGAHAALLGGPVLLTPSTELDADVRDYSCGARVPGYVYGGVAAIDASVADAFQAALNGEGCTAG